MSKLTPEEFREYLKTVRALAEGPFEEMQKEVEVTNKFPQEFYDLAIENNLYRYALPEEYGGWGLSEKEILQVQEEFSRGPGGMRMHLHYAADLNWRILDDYGKPELKAEFMDKFQDKTIFTNFALTEQTGGTGADLHTTALKDENGNYVLNGEKWLISHTDCSQYAYVIAVTDPDKKGDERLSAFFVPVDTPGFELVPMPHMMGGRGAGQCLGRKPDRVADDMDGWQGRGVLVDDELALHGGLLETVPCRYGKRAAGLIGRRPLQCTRIRVAGMRGCPRLPFRHRVKPVTGSTSISPSCRSPPRWRTRPRSG